jgi:hypothetical protein
MRRKKPSVPTVANAKERLEKANRAVTEAMIKVSEAEAREEQARLDAPVTVRDLEALRDQINNPPFQVRIMPWEPVESSYPIVFVPSTTTSRNPDCINPPTATECKHENAKSMSQVQKEVKEIFDLKEGIDWMKGMQVFIVSCVALYTANLFLLLDIVFFPS